MVLVLLDLEFKKVFVMHLFCFAKVVNIFGMHGLFTFGLTHVLVDELEARRKWCDA